MAALLAALLPLGLPAQGAHMPPVRAAHGMVVAGHRLAAEAGLEVLRAGGNAVDAAVATAFAMAVVSPKDGNLGGGGFLVTRSAEGSARALDFREVAPERATRDMFLDERGQVAPRRSLDGWLAVAVPAAVAGYAEAANTLGALPLRRLIEPAIGLASDGFALSEIDARWLHASADRLARDPAARAIFVRRDRPFTEGDIFRQPDLAATLESIARRGRDAFYQGETARLVAAAMESNGGLITTADLARYRPVWREPLTGTYRKVSVISMPPPSSGGVALLQMLAMTEAHDVGALGAGSSALIHLQAEVARRAFADRALHLGDPDRRELPVKELLGRAYLMRRMRDFEPAHATAGLEAGRVPHSLHKNESDHTTHISVVDARGGAASMTVTLNAYFGAAIVAPGTGFLLNDEMDDFSAKPGIPNQFGLVGAEANAIEPGKRPLSSMTPSIVTKDGKLLLVVGSPGGSKIITTVYQVILNVVDLGMDVQGAVSWPRTHHQWLPNRLRAEPFALSADVALALEARGHELDVRDATWSRADAILVAEDGRLEGGADPRGPHVALGF